MNLRNTMQNGGLSGIGGFSQFGQGNPIQINNPVSLQIERPLIDNMPASSSLFGLSSNSNNENLQIRGIIQR